MSSYEDPEYENSPEPAPEDDRVILMRRFVDLDAQQQRAKRDAEHAAKAIAIIGEELRKVRDELGGVLGYPSNSGGMVDAKAALKAHLYAEGGPVR